MPRAFTPVDAHALMNALVKQATGQQSVTVTDTSSFVSAGEMVLATGTENVLNAISVLVGRTFMAVRPYDAKLKVFNAINTAMYTNRFRKISFYAKDAQPAGFVNTNLYTNLKDGYTNGQNTQADPDSTKSMWEQNQAVPLEMNFAGQSVWQDSITIYENQLKIAFRSEDEFMSFMTGIMTERENDIESQKEAFNRLTLLNAIAGRIDMTNAGLIPNGAINLVDAFNTRFSTSYTADQLRTTYLTDFLAFMVSMIKQYSNLMTYRNKAFHWSPAKQIDGVDYTLLRHTPKDRQKLIMYSPLFVEATAQVLPEIFNPQYLDIGNYEGVDYWQGLTGDLANNPAINVTPAIPTAAGTQTAGGTVNIPYIVGFLFDEDALMTDFQYEDSISTPIEARKHYRNIWWSFSKNAINDFTENGIVFYMADPDGE